MRAACFLVVASSVFIAAALLTDAIVRVIGLNDRQSGLPVALLVAAILGSGVGALWRRMRRPAAPERWVTLKLGAMVSITAVAFALAYQAVSGWLPSPAIIFFVAAIGCFLLALLIADGVGRILAAAGWPPKSQDADPASTADRPRE